MVESLKININEKNFKIDLKKISLYLKKKPKIFFLSLPNSPIEANISLSEIKKIIDLCKKYNCLIVFDEAYHGFGSKSQIQKYK